MVLTVSMWEQLEIILLIAENQQPLRTRVGVRFFCCLGMAWAKVREGLNKGIPQLWLQMIRYSGPHSPLHGPCNGGA